MNLKERVKELQTEGAFTERCQFFTSTYQDWANQGVVRGSYITPLMTGREIVRVATYSQHDRVIYRLETDLDGSAFLYDVDYDGKKLIAFKLAKK
jgi:hypothetical protein